MTTPEPAVSCLRRTCRPELTPHTETLRSAAVSAHRRTARHPRVDHPAGLVPVAAIGNPVIEYGFCSAPDAAWVYRCADGPASPTTTAGTPRHGADGVETETGPGQRWGETWAAGAGCVDLIEQRPLYGLIARVVDATPARYRHGNRLLRIRGEPHTTYRTMLATLAPRRARITPHHRLGICEPATTE